MRAASLLVLDMRVGTFLFSEKNTGCNTLIAVYSVMSRVTLMRIEFGVRQSHSAAVKNRLHDVTLPTPRSKCAAWGRRACAVRAREIRHVSVGDPPARTTHGGNVRLCVCLPVRLSVSASVCSVVAT